MENSCTARVATRTAVAGEQLTGKAALFSAFRASAATAGDGVPTRGQRWLDRCHCFSTQQRALRSCNVFVMTPAPMNTPAVGVCFLANIKTHRRAHTHTTHQ